MMVNSPPNDQLDEFEEEIERIYEISDALENSYKSKTKNLSNLEENLHKLSTFLSETNDDTARLKANVQTLLSAKSDTDSTDTCEDLIETLENLIQKETDERIYYTKKLKNDF